MKMSVGSRTWKENSKSKLNENVPKAELNSRGCLILADIINSFHTPISEEHAWALCFQLSKCGQNILSNSENKEKCHLVSDLHHVLIQRDGNIHPDTFLDSFGEHGKGPPRTLCSNEAKLISNLVLVIFLALDYGMSDDDERTISTDLESLLDSMASADVSALERAETDDEGIERDSGDSDEDPPPPSSSPSSSSSLHSSRNFDFNSILQTCSRRVSCSGNGSSSSAESHYRAVCRAYVAEALELSTFLQKVSKGTQNLRSLASQNGGHYENYSSLLHLAHEPDPELDKLHFTDWARLWVQVIRDLRQGVKLKKVEFCPGAPIEYELTPYEILMDDIRSRRYKLNKVMVDGTTLPPRIKKDAHAIILEFIRSRPPLKKAAERILGPAPAKNPSPIEKLMESIRQEHRLTPVLEPKTKTKTHHHHRKDSVKNSSRRPNSSSDKNNKMEKSSDGIVKNQETTQPPQPQRRLIKADLNFLDESDSKDEDDFELSDSEVGSEPVSGFYGHICPDGSQSTPLTPLKRSPEHTKINESVGRRHSIGNPLNTEGSTTSITFPYELATAHLVFSSQLRNNKKMSASPILARRAAPLPRSVSKSSLQEEFFGSAHWQTAIECLSLNLEEVVHIRHVLTKAELESLPLDCSLKQDVEKGKVCFLCLKTRFSLFGPWSNLCKLCKRTICTKCCSKMRIPTEQFANVPVSTLSPSISPQHEEKELPGSTQSLTPTNSLLNCSQQLSNNSSIHYINSPHHLNSLKDEGGSRSSSPGLMSRKSDTSEEDLESRDTFGPPLNMGQSGPRSLPTVQSISLGLMAIKRRSFGRGRDDDQADRRGSLMIVCHDCKAMVLQIIKSSHAKKTSNLLPTKTNMVLHLPPTSNILPPLAH